MIIFELLSLILFVLFLLYLAFFSPKFDRFMKKLFNRNPESADGIADKVSNIEADKVAAKAALAAREASLAAEKAKLDKIQVK
jgi:hypothetical protein